jgi:hypothetical protein
MSESSRFAREASRQADELWNVALFPLPQVDSPRLTPGGLENADERRSVVTFLRPLRVSHESSSGILV